jgi:hypothetical protein
MIRERHGAADGNRRSEEQAAARQIPGVGYRSP